MGTLQAVDRGISRFLLRDIFARGLSERGGGFLDVENVVSDLKCPADVFAKAAKPRNIFFYAPTQSAPAGDGSANQRCCLRAVDVLQHFVRDRFAFGFEVGNLAADHAVDRACGGGDLGQHRDAALGIDRSRADNFECKREQRVAGENSGGFAEFFVARGLAAAKIVVVERRQVVMDQRIGMNEFDRASRMSAGEMSGLKMRAVSRQRIGRMRLPPASTL